VRIRIDHATTYADDGAARFNIQTRRLSPGSSEALPQVASDRIALSLGTGRRMAVSVRDCGICGGELYPDDPPTAGAAGTAGVAGFSGGSGHSHAHGQGSGGGLGNVQLACKHLFHMDCIR